MTYKVYYKEEGKSRWQDYTGKNHSLADAKKVKAQGEDFSKKWRGKQGMPKAKFEIRKAVSKNRTRKTVRVARTWWQI